MVIEYEGTSYDFSLEEIDVAQAMMIKVKTGLNLTQWETALGELDVEAVKALYWLMLDQNGKKHSYDTLNFKVIKFAKAVQAAQKTADDAEESADPTDAKHNDG